MTEAQKKAAAQMYEMSMKARGLSEELAREKKITQFSALATERYGADVAGAQAAVERFTKAIEASEEAKKQEAANKDIIDAVRERVKAVRHMDFATRQQRIDNLKAYVAANKDALDQVLEANKILADELEALERGKFEATERWLTEAGDLWLQVDKIVCNALEDMSTGLTDLVLKGKADFRALAQSVIYDITRMMIKMQMAELLGIGGFGGGGGGGIGRAALGAAVGLAGGAFEMVFPPTVGQKMAAIAEPGYYQSGGKVRKSGWAEVHAGETFSGVNQGSEREVTVNLLDQRSGTTEKLEVSRAESYMLSGQRIIDVFIQGARTNRGVRKAIADALR